MPDISEYRLIERLGELIVDMEMLNADEHTRSRELSLAITEAEYVFFRLKRYSVERERSS